MEMRKIQYKEEEALNKKCKQIKNKQKCFDFWEKMSNNAENGGEKTVKEMKRQNVMKKRLELKKGWIKMERRN